MSQKRIVWTTPPKLVLEGSRRKVSRCPLCRVRRQKDGELLMMDQDGDLILELYICNPCVRRLKKDNLLLRTLKILMRL